MKITNTEGIEFTEPVTVPAATADGHALNRGTADGRYVAGPASAVADCIATFDGATGKLLQDSGAKISDLAAAGHTHAAGARRRGGAGLGRG